MDFNRPYRDIFDSEEDKAVFAKVAAVSGLHELADRYGVKMGVMWYVLYLHGIPYKRTLPKKRAERKSDGMLKDKEYLLSHKTKEIAERYGVSDKYVRYVLRANGLTKLDGMHKKDDIGKWSQTFNRGRIRYVYYDMLRRCTKPSDTHYAYYGGRGISVCEEWRRDCKAFYRWARDSGYAQGLQIDRIDCDGNYSPENCRWVTPRENTLNRRCTRRYTFNGVTKTAAEWAEEYGFNSDTLRDRLTRYGWGIERALTEPLQH